MRIEIVIGGLLATAFWAMVELFYRPDASGLWEVIKLIVQFAGALIIARLTVQWALGRFKTEKSWERQTTAFAEILASLRETIRVLDKWIGEELGEVEWSKDYKIKLEERWQKAEAQFRDAAALGMLILPDDVGAIVAQYESATIAGDYETLLDRMEADREKAETALRALVAEKHRFIVTAR
jgi:hypothetical protein